MKKTREERNEVFIEWITFTEDRIIEWKRTISNELAVKLNWTPESLPVIEQYIIENPISLDEKDRKKIIELDAIISYVSEVFRKNIPETTWKIDLDDKTNIFYNLPYLVFKLGVPICPHQLIQKAIIAKTGSIFSKRFNLAYKDWCEYKAWKDKQKG